MKEWNKVTGNNEAEILGNCPAKDLSCLVIRKGEEHIEPMDWNASVECWDDPREGVFECYPEDVSFWMAFPKLPEELRTDKES